MRRKNFLFSGDRADHKRYEVRIYIYGKAGFEAQGEQNIKRKKFTDPKAAKRWLDANRDYPLVELVDLHSDHVLFSGGTGRKFNPRKKRKELKRRDVYAEMAKARKTTKGHKRKDRKRSVARGSSRKPKHKMRLNPVKYESPTKDKATFGANVKKRQSKILGMYRGFLAALEREGVKKLPSAGEIRDDAMQGAVLIESTRYPELRSQSKEARGAQDVAAEVLGIGPGGEFAAYAQTYPEIFELHLKDTVELLRKERKKLRASERKDAKRIDKAREDFTQERATSKAAQIAALQAQIEAKKSEIADYGDYEDEDEGELDADTAAELAEVYGMTPGEEAEEEQLQEVAQREKAVKKGRKKRKKTVEYVEGEYVPPTAGMSKEKMERLGKYASHLTPVRRTDVQPPLNLLGKTRQDVLLYVLKDGTTQVWMKGSLTVTFEPTARIPSWTIAHRYANRWRGLSPSGSVRRPTEGEPPVKKSRLRTGVYAAVEGQDKLKKIEDPINIVEKRDRKLERKQYDMPDFDKYELIGDRANPRRRRKNGDHWYTDFFIDHEYDSKRHDYVERLFARMDGQVYRVALTRIKELYGVGPKEMDGSSVILSESDWRYLRPVKAKVASGPSETAHLANPRSRKNPTYLIAHDTGKGDGVVHYLVEATSAAGAEKQFWAEKKQFYAKMGANKYDSSWSRPDRQLGASGTVKVSLYTPNPRRRRYAGKAATLASTNGSWERQSDGSYYKGGERVGYLVKKERVRIGTRDMEMWALYHFNKKMDTGWRRQEHHRTLAEAKKAAAPLRGIGKLGHNPRRRKNVPFGQGKPERNHPYANTLRSAGLKYTHSVPVTHSGGKVYHHVYRLGDTDFYVSYYQKPGGKKWIWEGSVSGSGRMHQGFGMSALAKYLRGAVPRHSKRYPGKRRANPNRINAEMVTAHKHLHEQGKCLGCGPKRRKNIMASAGGDYDYGYDSYSPKARKGLNPYAKRYTLSSFSEKYWGKGHREVPRTIRMEFWDDFKYGYTGGLARYKSETRGQK